MVPFTKTGPWSPVCSNCSQPHSVPQHAQPTVVISQLSFPILEIINHPGLQDQADPMYLHLQPALSQAGPRLGRSGEEADSELPVRPRVLNFISPITGWGNGKQDLKLGELQDEPQHATLLHPATCLYKIPL